MEEPPVPRCGVVYPPSRLAGGLASVFQLVGSFVGWAGTTTTGEL